MRHLASWTPVRRQLVPAKCRNWCKPDSPVALRMRNAPAAITVGQVHIAMRMAKPQKPAARPHHVNPRSSVQPRTHALQNLRTEPSAQAPATAPAGCALRAPDHPCALASRSFHPMSHSARPYTRNWVDRRHSPYFELMAPNRILPGKWTISANSNAS